MDDWKLKTSPVVRLERPNERFVDSQSQPSVHRININNNQCILHVVCFIIKYTKLLALFT